MPFSLSCKIFNALRLKLTWCVSFTALCFFSSGQLPDNWYLNKVLNDNSGLPQNSVLSVYFDKETGFLWMTTEAGLVRYDGVNSHVFGSKDLPSLKSIRMFTLFPTLRGDILGCNRLGEIFIIKDNYPVNANGHRIRDFSPIFSSRKRNVRSIKDVNFETSIYRQINKRGYRSSSLWINDSAWLGIFDDFAGFFQNEKLICRWRVKKMGEISLIARNGFVYVMDKNAGGYCINLTDKTLASIHPNSKALLEENPLLFYDNQNDQPLLLNKNNLYELEFNRNEVSAKLIATLKNLPSDITSVLLHNNKRMVFIATNTTGVHIYHYSPFRVYRVGNDNLLNNNYASVLTDSSHIFTCRSLVFDLNTGNHRKIPIPINSFRSMAIDAENNIWNSTEGNIIRFKIGDPAKLNKYPVAEDNYLRTFFLARNGKFWISTARFLGYKYNNTIKECIAFYSNADSSSFSFLTETAAGRLVGVNDKGIYFIDTALKKLIPVINNSQGLEVRNISIDTAGLWWIATYGKGVFLYDQKKNKLISFPIDDNGYLLYSHACIDDGYNNFLVPTNKGLFRLSKNNLLQIYAVPSTPLYYRYFDVSSGLLTNEFNGGCQPAFNRLPGGDIILPALQGLVRVKTNELPGISEYPLFVDFIETKSHEYKPGADMRFKEEERVQTWQLSFSQWDQPNSQDIFYRIDSDALWRRLPEGERKIRLTELTGGSHLLQVRYQYGLLQDERSLHQFKFYIPKKYYEQIWFWPCMIVLLAGIIALLIRLRMLRQALKLQTIRNNISADMHDEIGSTLSSISFYSEALLMQLNDGKHRKVLEKIKENAQNAQEGISDIIWSVKAGMDEMENVFNRMQSFGTSFLEVKNIYLHFETDNKLSGAKMSMADRKNFYLIFKEAVHNAAKYSACKNIWVKIESATPHLRMTIKDDGNGFDVQNAKNGNGLFNMQKRASQLKGRLWVESALMQGTAVTLVF